MSPKKEHEVQRMTAYIANLLAGLSSDCSFNIRHVVDIGAGQVSNHSCVIPLHLHVSNLPCFHA